MKRRQLLTAGSTLLLGNTLVVRSVFAEDLATEAYSREAFDAAVADGKPFMLDFYASW